MTTANDLNILMVTRGLPFHTLGGMEAVAWDLARAFASAGASVTVLTTRAPELGDESWVDGVRVLCLDVPSGVYSREWWAQSRRTFETDFAETVDVVISVSAGARSMVSSRSGSMPIFIAQAHGTAWGEFVSKIRQMSPLAWAKSIKNLIAMFQDRAFRGFDGFIAVGDKVGRDLTRNPTRWIIGGLPVQVIPNGVSERVFEYLPEARQKIRADLGLGDDYRIVFSASRLHPQKGIMEALEGFAVGAKDDPDLRYCIAGAGPDEARLKQRAAQPDLAGKVLFVGQIARDRILEWLSAADVFLFTTKRVEGLPLNILEALATGLPVVASAQVVEEKFGALSVNPDNPKEIAAGVQAALTQGTPATASRPSRLAPEFTLDHSAKEYLAAFQAMIDEKARSR